MSAERLGSVQKFILVAVYKSNGQIVSVKTLKDWAAKSCFENEKADYFFETSEWNKNTTHAIFSRAIRILENKDLIKTGSGLDSIFKKPKGHFAEGLGMKEYLKSYPDFGKNVKYILGLTEKGKAKAEELLKVKNLKT